MTFGTFTDRIRPLLTDCQLTEKDWRNLEVFLAAKPLYQPVIDLTPAQITENHLHSLQNACKIYSKEPAPLNKSNDNELIPWSQSVCSGLSYDKLKSLKEDKLKLLRFCHNAKAFVMLSKLLLFSRYSLYYYYFLYKNQCY